MAVRIRDWLNKAQKALLKEAPDSESARQEARFILAHTLKKEIAWTATHDTDSLGLFDLLKADPFYKMSENFFLICDVYLFFAFGSG